MTQAPLAGAIAGIEPSTIEIAHPAIKKWPAAPDTTFSAFLMSAARTAGAARVVEIGCEYGRHLGPAGGIAYTGVDYGYFIEFAHRLHPGRQWVKIDFDRYDAALFSALYEPDAIYVVRGRLEHVRDSELLLDCLAGFALEGRPVLVALAPEAGHPQPMFRRHVGGEDLVAAFRRRGVAAAPVGRVAAPESGRSPPLDVVAAGTGETFTALTAGLADVLARLGEAEVRDEPTHAADPDLTPESMLFEPDLPLLSTRRATAFDAPPELDVPSALARILDATSDRRPFSLIRLGNGEGRVLGFPDYASPIWLTRSLRNWFGPEATGAGIRAIQDEAATMIREADLIGVAWRALDDVHRVLATRTVDLYGLAGPQSAFCDNELHLRGLETGFFDRLLQGERRIALVCGHELGDAISQAFSVPDVRVYKVPAQAKFFYDAAEERHFPTVFERLRDELEVREPGELFLVGAGLLGKIYCGWIKQRGGIALDIGSVFDLWAGEITRAGFPTKVDRFRLRR